MKTFQAQLNVMSISHGIHSLFFELPDSKTVQINGHMALSFDIQYKSAVQC